MCLTTHLTLRSARPSAPGRCACRPEDRADLFRLLDPPGQIVRRALKRQFEGLLLPMDAWQARHMRGVASGGKFKNALKEIAGLTPHPWSRIVWSQGSEVAGNQEYVRKLQPAVTDLRREFPGGTPDILCDPIQAEVGTLTEHADVDAFDPEPGDEIQNVIVRQQGEREVGTRKLQF